MHSRTRYVLYALRIPIMLALVVSTGIGCNNGSEEGASEERTFVTILVKRQDMVIDVSATGEVEAIREIEIKSKASGKILRLPVEEGDTVHAGALLAQIDTTNVALQLRQKRADLEYTKAQFAMAERRRTRTEHMLQQGIASEDDYDNAVLEYARLQSALIRSESELALAQERRDDTVVRAPERGTILRKEAERGQIIASATSQLSEGTTLLKMADMTEVQVRVLIDQTDLGEIRPGMEATVTAEAYPDESFEAVIMRTVPVPKKERNINYYPVLIRIDNEDGRLLPGMSCDVEIHVARLDSVLTVSSNALSMPKDAENVAELLDIPVDSVRAALSAIGSEAQGPTLADELAEQMSGWALRQYLASQQGPAEKQDVAVVFVADSSAIRPVAIRIGTREWDQTEILDGIAEGTEVIVPPSSAVAKQFKEYREMIRRYGGMPGRK
jgi:HlyD family secretion protein